MEKKEIFTLGDGIKNMEDKKSRFLVENLDGISVK